MIGGVGASREEERGKGTLSCTESDFGIEVAPNWVKLNKPFKKGGLRSDSPSSPLIEMMMRIYKTWSE